VCTKSLVPFPFTGTLTWPTKKNCKNKKLLIKNYILYFVFLTKTNISRPGYAVSCNRRWPTLLPSLFNPRCLTPTVPPSFQGDVHITNLVYCQANGTIPHGPRHPVPLPRLVFLTQCSIWWVHVPTRNNVEA
jgi:hypothetical protein